MMSQSSRRSYLVPRTSTLMWLVALAVLLTFVACSDDPTTTPDSCEGASCGDDGNSGDADVAPVDTNAPDVVPDVVPDSKEPDVTPDTSDIDVPDDVDVSDDADTTEEDGELVSDDTSDVEPGCGYGSIHGRVCTPDGSDWLSDVEVSVSTIDCDGNPLVIQDFTDADGFYQLDGVPNGIHEVTIRTGSYTTTYDNVLVEAGKVTDLAGALTKTCLDRRAASIAVLTGTFDHVEDILSNLGITHQLYKGDVGVFEVPPGPYTGLYLLQNLSELLAYDILFINCGAWYETFLRATPAEVSLMRNNLITFVQSGGSIYVSDWAYFWAELAFPDAIDFAGDDLVEGSARKGVQMDNLFASVLSNAFIQAIGSDTMSIAFNSPAWVVAETVNYASVVHIMAPSVPTNDPSVSLTDVPILVSHKPTPTSGTIFFTSFHQEAQLTSSMEQVLRFLVFQL